MYTFLGWRDVHWFLFGCCGLCLGSFGSYNEKKNFRSSAVTRIQNSVGIQREFDGIFVSEVLFPLLQERTIPTVRFSSREANFRSTQPRLNKKKDKYLFTYGNYGRFPNYDYRTTNEDRTQRDRRWERDWLKARFGTKRPPPSLPPGNAMMPRPPPCPHFPLCMPTREGRETTKVIIVQLHPIFFIPSICLVFLLLPPHILYPIPYRMRVGMPRFVLTYPILMRGAHKSE